MKKASAQKVKDLANGLCIICNGETDICKRIPHYDDYIIVSICAHHNKKMSYWEILDVLFNDATGMLK